MPVTFGNPALLLGALAAVLPIVIHFLSRRRVRRVPFSDLRFLRDVQTHQARRLGMRRWLLLLLRVLILLLIALAMARPQWGGLAPGPGGARAVLVVVDASASMTTQQGAGEHDGTRFAAALDEARRMITELPDGSSVQVLLAGAAVRPLFAGWLPVRTLDAGGFAGARPTEGGFDLPAVLRAAARQVATAPGTPVELVVLSDLQNWPGVEAEPAPDLVEALRTLRAAGETRLLLRRVGEPVANGGVLSVELPRRAVRPGETVVVAARVLAGSPAPSYRLELDGRHLAEVVADAAPGQEAQVRFSLAVPGVGRHRGWVRQESDRLPADDARPFVLDVRDRAVVRIVHGVDRTGLGRGGWRYLAAALAPESRTSGADGGAQQRGDARPASDDAPATLVDLRAGGVAELAAGDLGELDVVVFVDPEPLGRQLLSGVVDWIRAGGAAVFALGDPTQAAYLEQTLLPALDLPPHAVFRARPADGGERTVVAAPAHPVFAGLPAEALATLEDVTWRRTFDLEEGRAQVLLALGGGRPVMLEAPLGAGRVLVLGAHFTDAATELASSPMFLPLWQRIVSYLAWRQTEAAGAQVVGEPPRLPLPRFPRDGAPLGPGAPGDPTGPGRPSDLGTVRVEGPDPTGAPASLQWVGDVPMLVGAPTERAGFHVFVADHDTLGVVAAAVPASESRPELAEAPAVAENLRALGLTRAATLDDAAVASFARALGGRELGPWLLALAAVLLLVELWVARGAERRPAAAS
ncbi:MAG: VWA domain-containing protein [Candidatus Krumholzibacteriia bacterium]